MHSWLSFYINVQVFRNQREVEKKFLKIVPYGEKSPFIFLCLMITLEAEPRRLRNKLYFKTEKCHIVCNTLMKNAFLKLKLSMVPF
jgi:hypothetical protein